MKNPLLACFLCLGLTTPLIGQSIAPASANSLSSQVAMAVNAAPSGPYSDSDWEVYVNYAGGTYNYYGTNRNDGSNISLSGAVVSGTKSRRIYTWNNSGTKYRVTRQAKDPNTIRLQVINSKGKVMLNRLLYY